MADPAMAGDSLATLLDLLVKGAPTSAVFAFLWWLERKERIQVTNKLWSVLESNADLNIEWKKVFAKRRGGGRDIVSTDESA